MGAVTQPMSTLVIPPCACGKESKEVLVPREGMTNWRKGKLIQDCFPELNTDDRERLISGVCGECWEKIFDDLNDSDLKEVE